MTTDTKKDTTVTKTTDVKPPDNQVPSFSSTNTVPLSPPETPKKEVTAPTPPETEKALTPSQKWMKEVNEIALMGDVKEAVDRLTHLIKSTAMTYSKEIARGKLVLIDKDTSAQEDVLRFVSLCSLLVSQRVVQLRARSRGHNIGSMSQLVANTPSFRNPALNKITAETIRNLV